MFIHTQLLLDKTNILTGQSELIEVPFVFNTNSIVAAWPLLPDNEESIPEHQKRRSTITLLDGDRYHIKFHYDEVCSWIDPSGNNGNKERNPYSPVPTLDISN